MSSKHLDLRRWNRIVAETRAMRRAEAYSDWSDRDWEIFTAGVVAALERDERADILRRLDVPGEEQARDVDRLRAVLLELLRGSVWEPPEGAPPADGA